MPVLSFTSVQDMRDMSWVACGLNLPDPLTGRKLPPLWVRMQRSEKRDLAREREPAAQGRALGGSDVSR